jgi:hypothetical protein
VRSTVAGILVASVMGAGCGGAAVSSLATAPSPREIAGIRVVDQRDLRYTCGSFPFDAGALDRAANDELDDTPVAAALRAHLTQGGPDIDFLPDEGWRLTGQDDTSAEFVTRDADGARVVEVAKDGTGWRVTGWGECQPRRVLPEGLGDAEWVLAPGQPAIGPETRQFDALVTERSCASGQSSEGRIAGPDLVQVDDEVLVTFAVRPLPGGANCPSNPATRVTVALGEPLGDRRLRDGGSLPARDPTTAP